MRKKKKKEKKEEEEDEEEEEKEKEEHAACRPSCGYQQVSERSSDFCFHHPTPQSCTHASIDSEPPVAPINTNERAA